MNRHERICQALENGNLHKLEDQFDWEDTMLTDDLEQVPTVDLIQELKRRHNHFVVIAARDGLPAPGNREITRDYSGDKLAVLGLLAWMEHRLNVQLAEDETPTDRA